MALDYVAQDFMRDELNIGQMEDGQFIAAIHRDEGGSSYVALSRDDVVRLRNALDAALGDTQVVIARDRVEDLVTFLEQVGSTTGRQPSQNSVVPLAPAYYEGAASAYRRAAKWVSELI